MSARLLVAVTATVATFGLVLASPASAGGQSELARVRAATAAFHDLGAATDAGYVQFLPCFDNQTAGMGQHFVRFPLDGTVDALRPESLVYEPGPDGYRLVGVEYIVPQASWTGSSPPSLFGEEFHPVNSLGIWALHAWIWRPNPDGMFADFNPKVRLCD